MTEHIHHTHLFTENIDATIAWWRDMLGAEVAFDGDFGGARNVFIRLGSGRIHLYEQPPRDDRRRRHALWLCTRLGSCRLRVGRSLRGRACLCLCCLRACFAFLNCSSMPILSFVELHS